MDEGLGIGDFRVLVESLEGLDRVFLEIKVTGLQGEVGSAGFRA